jgi:hypothetical protein
MTSFIKNPQEDEYLAGRWYQVEAMLARGEGKIPGP